MKHLIAILALLFSTISLANEITVNCIGMHEDGSALHVIYDSATQTINLDGTIKKIVEYGKNDAFTVNYINNEGTYVYLDLNTTNGEWNYIKLVNAVTNKVIRKSRLACRIV